MELWKGDKQKEKMINHSKPIVFLFSPYTFRDFLIIFGLFYPARFADREMDLPRETRGVLEFVVSRRTFLFAGETDCSPAVSVIILSPKDVKLLVFVSGRRSCNTRE